MVAAVKGGADRWARATYPEPALLAFAERSTYEIEGAYLGPSGWAGRTDEAHMTALRQARRWERPPSRPTWRSASAGERLDGDGFGFDAGGVGDGQAVLGQALKVERDGFADELLDFGANTSTATPRPRRTGRRRHPNSSGGVRR